MKKFDRKIVLEDGSEYFGYGFGANVDRVCEIVFNTSMVRISRNYFRSLLYISNGCYDISFNRKLWDYR